MTAALSLAGAAPSLATSTPSPSIPSRAGSALEGLGRIAEGPRPSAPDFESLVRDAVGEVSSMQDRADVAAQGYVAGDHQDVHGTMIVMQEADISLRLAANVRNRVIEAYREVMRMGA
ncbi:MAG: flagellar hook-basal body complex protein FliE [Deltaproteobacteria bacterium]|nr:flagellar hook-basal body complex protein FliE [Deltaproteobacteria bacterium]